MSIILDFAASIKSVSEPWNSKIYSIMITGKDGLISSSKYSVVFLKASAGAEHTRLPQEKRSIWMFKANRVYLYRDPFEIGAFSWSPDGKYLASGSHKTAFGPKREMVTLTALVRVWQACTGDMVCCYTGHSAPVTALSWSPDGTCIASGGWDHTIHIWEVGTARQLATYPCAGNVIGALAWSPDGTRILSASSTIVPMMRSPDTIQAVWEVATGELLATYRGHTDSVSTAAWSPDGAFIASAGWDTTVQIWEANTGKHHFTYSGHRIANGHRGLVYEVAWSPDGNCIASTNGDEIAVWQAQTGERRLTLPLRELSVDWSPDGKYLATCGMSEVASCSSVLAVRLRASIQYAGRPQEGILRISKPRAI
jgi:WD40 repeat protein